MKKTILALTAAGTVLAVGAFTVSTVSAQETDTSRDTMISKLAEKLGLSTETVSTAFEETRGEMHTERVAEMESKLQEAYENGELTQRQYTIIDTMNEVREQNFEERTPGEKPEKGEMLETLNDAGLNVTEEEMQELRETMRDLELMGNGANRGMGRGMHR